MLATCCYHAGHDSGVLCPVCKSCELVLRQGLLVCPRQGWMVNLAAESISMDQIRSNLATAYQVRSHISTGAFSMLQPYFVAMLSIQLLEQSGHSCKCGLQPIVAVLSHAAQASMPRVARACISR